MNKERDKSYVFGKVCLSKKAFLNMELRQTERNINKGLDIIDKSTKVKKNNEEDELSLSNSKFLTLASFTDGNFFIQRMSDLSQRKKSSKLLYPKTFKISNQNSTIRKTRTNMTTRAVKASSKTVIDNKNRSSMTLHKIPLLALENEEYKPSRTQTQKTLNRFLAEKEIDKYKRIPKDKIKVNKNERATTANPRHKFQMNKLLSLQKKTNEIQQIIKHDRKIEEKLKQETNKKFLYSNSKALKAKRFKELKKDIGVKGKFPKDYFMDRLIRFSALNQRNQIIKFVNSDIAYSHRDVICKSIGFKWKDPFE